MSDSFEPAMPHGALTEVFPDLFQVTGTITMKSVFRFSRVMTVIRHRGELTLANTIRLDEAGLAKLEGLGRITNVFKLGGLHGMDDAFYVNRYQTAYYVLEGDTPPQGIKSQITIRQETELPLPGASIFIFKTPTRPESLLRLERDGGILVACDSLQNWTAPDEYTNLFTQLFMRTMGFYTPTTLGPAWRRETKPQPSDFERLKAVDFEHVLCAHGDPVVGDARARFAPSIEKHFGVTF